MNNTQHLPAKGNILVVDDTVYNLNLLRKIFSSQGYGVRPIRDGKFALKVVQLFQPDLILLDIMMPEIDGYEVCSRLKADSRTKDIPIIFISALNEVFDKVKAFEIGGVDYITKPFQEQEVLARVENQLRIQRLSKQVLEQNVQLSQEIEERKKAQVALAKSEKKYRHLVETSQDLIWSLDAQGRYTFVNQAVKQIYGYEPEEMIGCLFTDFQLPEQIALDIEVFQEVLQGESVFQYETTDIAKDGSTIELMVNAIALRDDEGNVVGATGTASNITQRKLAEEALRQQKELLQIIFDQIPVMIFMYDDTGQIFLLNREMERVLGWSLEEARNIDLLAECYPSPEDRQVALDFILEASGKWQDFKTRIKDGHVVDMSWANIRLSDGKCIGIGRDITERKQRELLEQIQKKALKMVAQGNSLHEILRELTHQVEELTPNMYASILLMDEDGQHLHPFVSPKLPQAFVEALEPLRIGPKVGSCGTAAYFGKRVIVEDIATDPLWAVFKDLALLCGLAACWSEPIFSEQGKVLGTFALYFSEVRSPNSRELKIIESLARLTSLIIERKQSEARELQKTQELEQAYSDLKHTQIKLIQAEKMSSLGRMIAGVAHEINNPVSFIYGNLNYARDYFQDLLKLVEIYQKTYPNPTLEIQTIASEIDLDFLVDDWSKLITSMQRGAERIRQIVLSLRNFSRLDEQELKLVDIHEGIDNTLLILQHQLRAESAQKEIEVIKDYSQLPKVTCYASQLNQVFMNLLNNAIDALKTPPFPKKITVSTSVSSHQKSVASNNNPQTTNVRLSAHVEANKQQITNYVVIRIADNGSGMSEEVSRQIFDPFFTTKPIGSGTGLGLAISHQIVVEKHKGQISCISAPGQGTEMIIEIPINRNNEE